jgi:Outer membrane protein beta-barrel domain
MKKLSLLLLGALAVTQVAQASSGSFNGFYLGAQLGWTQRNHKADLDNSWRQTARDALKKSKKANGMTYGLYTGYGQNNNGFYWGGEFNLEHSTANKKLNYEFEAPNAQKVQFKYTYDRGVVFGLAPRLGAVIDNNNLIYAKLGLEMSKDTVKVEGSEKNKSKTNVVFVPGFGYERAFGHLLARVEYGYNMGGKVKYSDATVKYSAHVLKFGLAYKF